MKECLILGFGISGQAAARLAVLRGYRVTIVDEHEPSVPEEYALIPNWNPQIPLKQFDCAVISPGISIDSPLADAVRSAGTPVFGELEFAASDLPCKIVAITGTNGKTTTTELTTALFQAAGYRCESAGNIGTALSDTALELQKGLRQLDILVVETSSFQLESMKYYAPASAALLNLASDHINRHGSMKGYTDAKFRLFRNLARSAQTCTVNRALLSDWNAYYPETPTTFSASAEADFDFKDGWLRFQGTPFFLWEECPLKGDHNIENTLAALALLRSIDGNGFLFTEKLKETLRGFRPDKHRIELFAEKNGVSYIDDSKATNPHSVNAALKTVGKDRNVLLLLGGSDKDMDFRCIAADSGKIKQAFLYGQSAGKIHAALKDSFPCCLMNSFESAVETACRSAGTGDVVLLSPACASFDLFQSYKARGDRFQELVTAFLGQN